MRKQMAGAVVATLALMTTAAAVYRAGEAKIAFVDTNVLMSQAPGRAEAEAQYNAAVTDLQKQAKTLDDSSNVLIKLYNAEMAKTDTMGRGKRLQPILSADSGLKAELNKLRQKQQQAQMAIGGPLAQLMRTSIDAVREEGGYTAIFDVGQHQDGSATETVSIDKNHEITDKVLARMKVEAAKPKPASKVPLPKSGGGGGN